MAPPKSAGMLVKPPILIKGATADELFPWCAMLGGEEVGQSVAETCVVVQIVWRSFSACMRRCG